MFRIVFLAPKTHTHRHENHHFTILRTEVRIKSGAILASEKAKQVDTSHQGKISSRHQILSKSASKRFHPDTARFSEIVGPYQ